MVTGCGSTFPSPESVSRQASETDPTTSPFHANVSSVQVIGEPNAYHLAVEISSPDTGCDQYADWWEVLGEDGILLYRRMLLHSHVDEQPFTRSGGPVPIDENTVVVIRAHMNHYGYGGWVLRGSVSNGFETFVPDVDFASNVETLPPVPEDCAF